MSLSVSVSSVALLCSNAVSVKKTSPPRGVAARPRKLITGFDPPTLTCLQNLLLKGANIDLILVHFLQYKEHLRIKWHHLKFDIEFPSRDSIPAARRTMYERRGSAQQQPAQSATLIAKTAEGVTRAERRRSGKKRRVRPATSGRWVCRGLSSRPVPSKKSFTHSKSCSLREDSKTREQGCRRRRSESGASRARRGARAEAANLPLVSERYREEVTNTRVKKPEAEQGSDPSRL